MDLKVGDTHKCPEGHMARIVWINEDKTVIAVKCPREHLSKIVQGRRIYDKSWVFLIRI
jgi:hypothetical protein